MSENNQHMMQTETAKKAVKLSNMSVEIPKSEKMVSVGALLTEADAAFMKEFAIGRVCVKIDNEVFFLNKLHNVPATAKLVRQEEGTLQGQVVGIPAVAGG